ncbi:MAG: excinuclease ABC subunit A [Mariniblastus sp.]|jgi:excinuclease ABC subunit A
MNNAPTMAQGQDNSTDVIRISGARTHNLKNIDVEIPRDQVVVVTGRSGSGKSSLAFDTLYAEGQRQYIESLSIFSRQFFNQLPRADVDSIEGIQPTLCLDQSHHSANRRSTVGTVTEVYDYLRVLMARVGDIRCHGCGAPIRQQTPQQIRDTLLKLPERTKMMILAPVVTGQSGAHDDAIKTIRRERLVRVRVDGQIFDIDQTPTLNPNQTHTIEAVADRIIVRAGVESRLLEAIDNAVRVSGDGRVICCWEVAGATPDDPKLWEEKLYSTHYCCPDCDINYAEVQPRSFSFNSPFGACETCNGLGQFIQFETDHILDRSQSIETGAIKAWARLSNAAIRKNVAALQPLLDELNVLPTTRLNVLSEQEFATLLNSQTKGLHGLTVMLQKELATSTDEDRLVELEDMQAEITCADCQGARVSPQARSVFLSDKHIGEIVELSIDDAKVFFETQEFDHDRALIAQPILKEVLHRLTFLQKVGVGYLTLGRAANTLSGGEHQRVRLATSIGTGITNVCFVLDEPSIGLHQHDNDRLIAAIVELKESGNSVIVVEHDEAMIRAADHVIDMGPGAGRHGGRVVAAGDANSIQLCPESLTGQFLSGQSKIEPEGPRRAISDQRMIKIVGARGHNLKNIDVEIPLGVFCCVTGVSGSGKSTLINQTLAPAIARKLDLVARSPEPYSSLLGTEQIDKLILVDQKPIGRTPRACPATYSGVFDEFRRLFAATKLAKQRGYGVSRFSFNSKTGWCPDCQGHGIRRTKMNFMPDINVTCETCNGRRFTPQTLQIRFGELTIADVLNLTIDQAIERFDGFSKIQSTLQSLSDVGLGYLLLGQSSTTLSGGEAQRVKLATELAKPETGNTLYILDEPTTGLHFEDIRVLIGVLNRLVDKGNSMIVIEHNLDLIRCADWIIDLGPSGGSNGGQLMGVGTPETLAANPNSLTGRYL